MDKKTNLKGLFHTGDIQDLKTITEGLNATGTEATQTLMDGHASTKNKWPHRSFLEWEASRVSKQLHQFWRIMGRNDSVLWLPLLLGKSNLSPLKSVRKVLGMTCVSKSKQQANPVITEQMHRICSSRIYPGSQEQEKIIHLAAEKCGSQFQSLSMWLLSPLMVQWCF